jgi:hypothetical protein
MSTQLLIYESAVPVSAARHAKTSIVPTQNYAFTAAVNAVPLMALEFLKAATDYAIVFSKVGDELLPAVVLGAKGNHNLYVSEDGKWTVDYIPAFLRRYPFVFASNDDGNTLTLCIDEAHPGVNKEGLGQRLFGDDGKPSAYTQRVLDFLKQFQMQFERTRRFCKRVQELDLLEPMQAQVTTPKGDKVSLGGFLSISRRKLRALDAQTLASLAKTDELELLYLQLHSLRNFVDLKDRLLDQLKEDELDLGEMLSTSTVQ